VTARELDALLIVCAVSLAVGMVALAGWPSFLHWRRRPRPVVDVEVRR
jgi:hypothetical protein